MLAVLLAWSTALLVVPRAVPPTDVPEAMVARSELTVLRAREGELTARARASLPPAVRALGSAVRAVGRAESRHDAPAVGAAQNAVASARASISTGMLEDLRALRAYQTSAFVAALHAWEETGASSDDLLELGGGLVEVLVSRCEPGPTRRIAMDDDEIAVAFRKRWIKVAGVSEGPLALPLALAEERLLFDVAVRHAGALSRHGADARSEQALSAQALLRRIDTHARIDPDYPSDYARGVVFYRAGQFARAVQAFNRHLERHGDGPLARRAQGHARAAVAAEVGAEPDEGWLPL